MARIRSVHPDICVSATMASLPAELERTFVRLWTHCDDHGRCQDNPRLIRAALYPLLDDMTTERVNVELEALSNAGLLWRYKVDGCGYLQVRSWNEFQHPNRPKKSKWPAPLAWQVLDTDEALLEHGEGTAGVGEGGTVHALALRALRTSLNESKSERVG